MCFGRAKLGGGGGSLKYIFSRSLPARYKTFPGKTTSHYFARLPINYLLVCVCLGVCVCNSYKKVTFEANEYLLNSKTVP